MPAWARGLALVAALTACSIDIDGPRGTLIIDAGDAEVVEGSALVVRATFEGRVLGPNEIEWLSRDPSTFSMRDGVVTGLFPGIAWAVARHGKVVDSVRIVVRFADLAPGEVGVRIGSERAAHRLNGLMSYVDLISEEGILHRSTSIVVSSGPPPVIDDHCCRLLGDTLLQVIFMALPTTGIRMLQPPVTTIETRATRMLVRTGPDDALLMLRDPDGRMRFYVPIKPALLQFTRVEIPPSQPPGVPGGVVEGRIAFEAAGVYESYGPPAGETFYTPIGEQTTTIYAEFTAPVMRSRFAPPPPPPPPPSG